MLNGSEYLRIEWRKYQAVRAAIVRSDIVSPNCVFQIGAFTSAVYGLCG